VRPLLILLALMAAVWLWRSRQRPGTKASAAIQPEPPKPLEMVRCSRCGVHLPGNEVVIGERGAYCSLDHRQQSES